MPTISVIVPVYKVEKYLKDCVESIKCQTFTDIEIILIDDGSPDNCGNICDELALTDSRIKVIHQSNAGLSGARNTGIDASNGQYICFVDSDDLIAPTYCEKLYNLLVNTEYDFSFCNVLRFDDGNEPIVESSQTFVKTIGNVDYLKMQFERKTEFGVWNKLFKKELFNTIKFAVGKLHEDVIFSADLVSNFNSGIIYTNEKLYFYRQRKGSIVANGALKCSPDRIFAGQYLLNAVKNKSNDLISLALKYAIDYPWMFIDSIYLSRNLKSNKEFLNSLQDFLKHHIKEYVDNSIFSKIQLHRMKLYSKSKILYFVNVYGRLIRLYIYRIFNKDPYKSGHGI